MKNLSLTLVLFAFLSTFFAACGTLQSGGVYNGDTTLYRMDSTAATSYQAIDAALKWETPIYKTLSPAAQAAFNKVRIDAPKAFKTYLTLRAAYVANTSSSNLTKLQQSVTDISALLSSIIQWIPAK